MPLNITIVFREPGYDEIVDKLAGSPWARFGRKRHRAALNFGDCLTYAVAKLAGRPLLFVGDDFARTDLERA